VVSYWPTRRVLQLVTVPIAAPPQIIGTLSWVFFDASAQQVRS
jgi:hypothetical protein